MNGTWMNFAKFSSVLASPYAQTNPKLNCPVLRFFVHEDISASVKTTKSRNFVQTLDYFLTSFKSFFGLPLKKFLIYIFKPNKVQEDYPQNNATLAMN